MSLRVVTETTERCHRPLESKHRHSLDLPEHSHEHVKRWRYAVLRAAWGFNPAGTRAGGVAELPCWVESHPRTSSNVFRGSKL